jgi:hypothetical protein
MGTNASNANGSWIGFSLQAFVFYQGHCIQFPYHNGSNLPITKLAPGVSQFQAFHGSLTDSNNISS